MSKETQDEFIESQRDHKRSLQGDLYEKIDHPEHYTKGHETSEYIISWDMDFLEGNVIKYVTRYKFKHGIDDLKKAEWYLRRLIENEKSKLGHA